MSLLGILNRFRQDNISGSSLKCYIITVCDNQESESFRQKLSSPLVRIPSNLLGENIPRLRVFSRIPLITSHGEFPTDCGP